jgi:hypothetical protein
MRRRSPFGLWPDALFFIVALLWLEWGFWASLFFTIVTSSMFHDALFEWRYGPKKQDGSGS